MEGVKYVVVLTKSDKLSASTTARRLKDAKASVKAALGKTAKGLEGPEVIVTSSKTRPPQGRDLLWKLLWETLL